ncbi:NADAR family protein [Kitasatospora sp. NPDC001175]|uniref:NADAR family protein n=1 Tax=Kitasatospora sp. NPDC001175 TaxID=3157103 RepID=UPI003CFF3BCB
MSGSRRTFRHADGERIPGTWRHVFIRNGGDYFLTDLLIYADGLVDCWGLVTVEELAEKLRSGWVATTLEDGARASAHHVAAWKFAEVQSWTTPEELLGEVRDEIDRLNGRPDSTGRCLAAVTVFRAEPSEEQRAALREAYLAIPEHLRRYALGDMDSKDWPLKVLAAGPGARLLGGGPVVTDEMYRHALEYFAERDQAHARAAARRPLDGADVAHAPAIELGQVVYPGGWPADPGVMVLRNEYPAPIEIDGVAYPTVSHAYWALSTTDDQYQAAIRAANTAYDAQQAAKDAPLRPGWEQARAAVMARLLRAKFTQHSNLAKVLVETGDATILYTDMHSRYWSQHDRTGRNWTGRLLELVRAEIAAAQHGLTR